MTNQAARPPRRINWHLILGSLLVLLILAIAIWGPAWAPEDPMQNNAIVEFDGKWVSAPFPPFTYERFPLGTDQNGRDILSQVLWAVRPTMIMVSIVAVVRMAMGLLIGLAAGWLENFLGRWLNNLIATAVSAPVLIVALAVIAAVGIDLGVTAFILGLAATGWAETARLVSEQTRKIRRMPYIEAARSLGQSSWGLINHHVLRQIAPMIWMLFSFEISSTLLTSASLGFLGYYIGGEVWTPVTDTSAIRSSGMPELGLMVATLSTDIFVGPYKMAAAGTLIFLTILGFNLLGEGLRFRLEHGSPRTSAWALWRENAGLWLDQHVLHPVASSLRRSRTLSAGLGLLLVAAVASAGWLALRPRSAGVIPAELRIPGDHLWASQLHDPFASAQTGAAGPQSNPRIAWVNRSESSFSGGPVISSDGKLFITKTEGSLVSYNSDGKPSWPTYLIAEPVGSPAISEEGRVYIADVQGGLTAVSPLGVVLWYFQPQDSPPATSGPIVDRSGVIYYMRAGQVQAVAPQGEALWLSQARNVRTPKPPAISPDGKLIFATDAVLRASDGYKHSLENLPDARQFFTGADGRLYAHSGFLVAEWQLRNEAIEIVHRLDWEYQLYGLISPASQAGATSDSSIWLNYISDFEDGHFLWLSQDGKVTGEVRYPHREAIVIGADGSGVVYICGTNRTTQTAECLALQNGRDEPLWTLSLPYGTGIAGGAIGPGTLYVATVEGYLMAITSP
jgi:ABC-type dipeptide/oligopeptide/nickel transport system permease subunit/outer membrane protein assembly factor BamB